MSDFSAHLHTLRARAENLGEKLDHLVIALMAAEETASEITSADLGIPGELSVTDSADLLHDLATALHAVRGAERTNDRHLAEITDQQARLARETSQHPTRPGTSTPPPATETSVPSK